MRCSLCGREEEPQNFFCLVGMRGATEECKDHIVVCEDCLCRLKDVLDRMELKKDGEVNVVDLR